MLRLQGHTIKSKLSLVRVTVFDVQGFDVMHLDTVFFGLAI